MYRAKVRVKKDTQIVDEYYFSDDDKGKLLLCATSWFLGYLRGILDFGKGTTLYMPCVMSIDGYHAWSKDGHMTVELLNENNEIITNEESIIDNQNEQQ